MVHHCGRLVAFSHRKPWILGEEADWWQEVSSSGQWVNWSKEAADGRILINGLLIDSLCHPPLYTIHAALSFSFSLPLYQQLGFSISCPGFTLHQYCEILDKNRKFRPPAVSLHTSVRIDVTLMCRLHLTITLEWKLYTGSLFTLRKPCSPLRINGEQCFLGVDRLFRPIHHTCSLFIQRKSHTPLSSDGDWGFLSVNGQWRKYLATLELFF